MQQHEKLLSQQSSWENMLSLQSPDSLPQFLKTGLANMKKYENVRRQGLEQRIIVCDLLKAKGNSLLKEHLVQEACAPYEQGLCIFRYIMQNNSSAKKSGSKPGYEHFEVEGETQKDMNRIKELKIALYNKLTTCYMKLGNYEDAVIACDEALVLYRKQPKTLYRRAKSILCHSNLTVEKYNVILDNLKEAQIYLPNDKSICQLMEKTKLELSSLQKTEQPLPLHIQSTPAGNASNTTVVQNPVHSIASASKGKENSGNTLGNQQISLTEAKSQIVKQQVNQRNEIWQMLHPNENSGNSNFDYALSYEVDPKKKVPPEVDELGRFLKAKCKTTLALYEKSGMNEQARILKENFGKALASKERIERISRLDFTRPTPQLRKVAENLGVELNDPSIMEELKKVQEQNLQDIKQWMSRMSQESVGTLNKKSREYEEKKSSSKKGESKANITNNYYINNNYYNHRDGPVEISKGRASNTKSGVPHRQFLDPNQHQEVFDLLQNISKLNEAEKNAKFARMINYVVGFLAIFLLLLTMYLDLNSLAANPREGPRDL